MSNQLVPMTLGEMQKAAQQVANSGLFGMKTTEEAFSLMLIAQAEGLHPAIAIRDYHIIEGKPALKADAMLARFQQAGGKVEWHQIDDNAVCATFTHPAGGSAKIEWNMAMAAKALLSTKMQKNGGPNMWQKYPRQMLRARVISEGIRTVFPGVIVGSYTPEEVQDFDDKAPKTMKNVTPTKEPTPLVTQHTKVKESHHDKETGEVIEQPRGPHAIAVPTSDKGKGPIRDFGVWAGEYIRALETSSDPIELEHWLSLNAEPLDEIKANGPRLFAKIDEVIKKVRTSFEIKDAGEGGFEETFLEPNGSALDGG